MIRSEPVERVSLYFRAKDFKKTIDRIGMNEILQFENMNEDKKPENMLWSENLKDIERLEQRLHYFESRVDKRCGDIDKSKSFIDIRNAINKDYLKLVGCERRKKRLEAAKAMLEENYVMASKSIEFFRKEVGHFYCVNFKFNIGIADRENKFLIKKTIKQRLRRNVYIKMYDLDLNYSKKQRTLFIVHAIGEDAMRIINHIIETFNGRIYNIENIGKNIIEQSVNKLVDNKNNKISMNKNDMNLNSTDITFDSNDMNLNSTDITFDSNDMNLNSTDITLDSNDINLSSKDNIFRDKNIVSVIKGGVGEVLRNANQKNNKIINKDNQKNNKIINKDNQKNNKIINKEKVKKITNIKYDKRKITSEKKEINNEKKYKINYNKKYVRRIEKKFVKIKKLNEKENIRLEKINGEIIKNYITWKYHLNKEKSIYETMNKFTRTTTGNSFIGEGWVLKANIERLAQIRDTSESHFTFEVIKSDATHPSHFKVSEFTQAFQNFTNVFGVPKYREINPAVFLIFTFPFMFGAMFGDIFHGILLGILALLMIKYFPKLNHNCGVLQIILEGRYVVLICAFTSIWFGFLYGDFASLPVALFSSQFVTGRTYPFGIDPIWHHATNKTVFINSVKMKLSIIIGFIHMSLGALIAISNALHFKDKVTLFCSAIPQFIIFFLFLGYLVFLCVYKWLVTSTYPSLVNTLIAMYTSPFKITEQMYPGQIYVQSFILATIIFCIPWMLFSKPLYLIIHKKVKNNEVMDLWISSAIHVVEFGLGLISNTSSYLRLWAVSLAHVQLTSVLHQFTIGNKNIFIAMFLSPIYIIFTFLLLIGLEGLSACLHALRLNWIEFFSKFYNGSGVKFTPLTYTLKDDDIY